MGGTDDIKGLVPMGDFMNIRMIGRVKWGVHGYALLKIHIAAHYNHFTVRGNTKSGGILDLITRFWYSVPMKSMDEQILRATKEIVVKFIEMGRLSPANVHESFKDIYATVNETVKKHVESSASSNGPST